MCFVVNLQERERERERESCVCVCLIKLLKTIKCTNVFNVSIQL